MSVQPEMSTNAQAVIDTATLASGIQLADPVLPQIVNLPAGARSEVLGLDRFLPAPRRKVGTYKVADVDSFIAYVQAHYDDARTTVWVDVDGRGLGAVLNDNAAQDGDGDGSAWGDHRVVLPLKHTDEWERWAEYDGQLLEQEVFAQLIEEGQLDILSPAGATMLELAQNFYASTSAQFKSGISLHDGNVSFKLDESAEASAGLRRPLEIPREFVLQLAPFVGEPTYRVAARFRWRNRSGTLLLGYKLDRPGDVLRDAMNAIANRLTDEAPRDDKRVHPQFARVYKGAPASPRTAS